MYMYASYYSNGICSKQIVTMEMLIDELNKAVRMLVQFHNSIHFYSHFCSVIYL